jgi:hypothetical protein
MDWAKAIEPHQVALARIVATLIAMVELASDGVAGRLPRPLYRALLRVLRPAESAVRRLIVVAAQGLVVSVSSARPMPQAQGRARSGAGAAGRRPAFQLFDPPRRISRMRRERAVATRPEPRLHIFDVSPLIPLFQPRPAKRAVPEPEDGRVGARRLSRRLAAVKLALETLPRQARRLARWRARLAKRQPPTVKPPLRPGPPPGYRQKPQQEIDWLLWECHLLAIDALKPDTS